jgi:hypothetical protein
VRACRTLSDLVKSAFDGVRRGIAAPYAIFCVIQSVG